MTEVRCEKCKKLLYEIVDEVVVFDMGKGIKKYPQMRHLKKITCKCPRCGEKNNREFT